MKPKALRRGDTIALVSPASPVSKENLELAVSFLEGAGFNVWHSPGVNRPGAYLAGTDAERAADLMEAFTRPGIDAVLCSRGGYGCARLFPFLDLNIIAASGRILAGFSDITTLHLALNRRGLPTLHAPMALTLSNQKSPWVYDSLLTGLTGGTAVPAEAPVGRCVVPGTAEGVTIGGCLCLLCDSIGTPNALETGGKLLFIEDVDENPHRVDAMLTHLRNSGLAAKASGIVIGEMTRTDERVDAGIGGSPWRDIVRDRLADLNIPVMTDYPFGHVKDMLTIPLGVRARMDAEAGTVEFMEPACI